MKKYVIFLRGINVGGRNLIKMADLKKTLSNLGLQNIKTLLASGNVTFETEQTTSKLLDAIKKTLQQTFSYKEEVILRSFEELQELAKNNPFEKFTEERTTCYVTFLSPNQQNNPPLPHLDYAQIIHATEKEICSALTLADGKKTTKWMALLEKTYGKDITTRNWNTIQKVIAL